jgi:hypothetical protein
MLFVFRMAHESTGRIQKLKKCTDLTSDAESGHGSKTWSEQAQKFRIQNIEENL